MVRAVVAMGDGSTLSKETPVFVNPVDLYRFEKLEHVQDGETPLWSSGETIHNF